MVQTSLVRFSPIVLQSHCLVEHHVFRCGVLVQSEVTYTLELQIIEWFEPLQVWFHITILHLQGVRVDEFTEISSCRLSLSSRVLRKEETVINPYFGRLTVCLTNPVYCLSLYFHVGISLSCLCLRYILREYFSDIAVRIFPTAVGLWTPDDVTVLQAHLLTWSQTEEFLRSVRTARTRGRML